MNNQLIIDYIPLANSIAFKIKKNLPNQISLDELKSAAYLGLTLAARKYNSSIGSFYNYAQIRIIGAIKDHLRFLSNYSNINTNTKDQYEDQYLEKDNLTTGDFFDFVSTKLDIKEYRVIRMYYVESKTMKEIGKIEGISESRISQIISISHNKLKKILKGRL